MTANVPAVFALAGLVTLCAPVPAVRAQEKAAPNSSTFRYVDEKRPARVYPVPPPDADPTGLSLEDVRARTTTLEERIERLEATIIRLEADLARLAKTNAKERRP
jgi:hypothetical protein